MQGWRRGGGSAAARAEMAQNGRVIIGESHWDGAMSFACMASAGGNAREVKAAAFAIWEST